MRTYPFPSGQDWQALQLSALEVDLLHRYWLGTVSPDELQQVEAWFAEVPARRTWYDQLRGTLEQGPSPVLSRAQRTQRIGNIVRAVAAPPPVTASAPSRRPRWPRRGTRLSRPLILTGSVIATAMAILFWSRTPAPSEPARTYTTDIGQRAEIPLANGSRAVLAPRSTMRVSGTVVELAGEALFEVTGSATTPFIVRTGRMTTRVLGTTFDVRHYATDHETRVTVRSGKVAVGTHKPIPVTAGYTAYANDSNVTSRPTGQQSHADWATGRLVFHRAPVSEVLETVHRWYGVRLLLADSALARQHVTTAFDIGSKQEMLRLLALVLDVTVAPQGNTDSVLILRPRQGKDARRPLIQREPGVFTFDTHMEVGR